MSASFTFGSFGDIITTVQLVWRLSQAISDSHGSAQEFQELVAELNRFHRTLDELLKFWQSRTQSAELDRLANSLKPAINDCRKAIESFFKQQFRKYARSFSPHKKGRKSIGDVFKRIRWSIVEKEKVTQLRDKLRRNKELMEVVHAIALGIAQEKDRELITARLQSLANAEVHAANQLEKQFGKVLGILEDQATLSANTNENIVAVLSELRTTNSRISDVQAGVASLPSIYASLDPHRHNSVFIEDALGATIPVPLDINPSWETVESMMRDQFRHRPGQELVTTKKYVLQDFVTGEDLNLRTEFHNLVRPGQKLAMAMIFEGMLLKGKINGEVSCCPKCGQEQILVVPGSDATWYVFGLFRLILESHQFAVNDAYRTNSTNIRCNFIFRRVLDLSDQNDDAIDKWLLQAEVNQYSTGALRDEHDPRHDFLRRIAERENLDGPNIFKRIRYISRWEDFEDSRGAYDTTINGIGFWEFGFNESANIAGWNMMTLAAAEIRWRMWISRKLNLDLYRFHCRLMMRFAGYTKRRSIPIFVLLVPSQEGRQSILEALRLLDFVRVGRIQVSVFVGPVPNGSWALAPSLCPPEVNQLVAARIEKEEGRIQLQTRDVC